MISASWREKTENVTFKVIFAFFFRYFALFKKKATDLKDENFRLCYCYGPRIGSHLKKKNERDNSDVNLMFIVLKALC